MKHPGRTVLSVCLLLAFSGNVPAVNVNDSSGYVNALGNNESLVTVTQDTTLTAQTPANAAVAPGFILEGQYSGSGSTVKLIGGTGSAMAFWSIDADVNTIRNLTFENFTHTIPGHDAGAVYLENGNITGGIHNVHFIGNHSELHGGGLLVYLPDPASSFSGGIHNSSFINNTSVGNGGGADINTGAGTPLTGDLTNNRIEGNAAQGTVQDRGLGGGLWIVHGLNGDMVDNAVTGNLAQYGGGMSLGNLTGNLVGSNAFTGNIASVHGGALYIHDDFVNFLPQGYVTGNITGATFTNNIAATGAGGAFYTPVMTGTISDSVFTGNRAGDVGGAIYLNQGNVTIENSSFIGNVSKVSGAGLYVREPAKLVIADSAFVGNASTGEAASVLHPNAAIGTGAAGQLRTNDLTLENLTVLGNTGSDAASLDRSAAFAYVNPDVNPAAVTISATGGQTARFYGNRAADTGIHRAIYFGHFDWSNPTTTNAILHTDAGSRLLMLDAMRDNGSAMLTMNFTKTGAGDWYLGGESQMRAANTWNVQQGGLVLTTVDYGAGATDAHVNLSHSTIAAFNLNAGGRLAGSGDITAQTITLNGTISPETWVNTGVKSTEIAAATDAILNNVTAAVMADASVLEADKLKTINQQALAQIQALVDVAKASDIGALNFRGKVTLGANSSTTLDAHPDASQSDRIHVTGDLDIMAGAAVHVRNREDSWVLNTPYPLIEATDSLTGSFANPVFTGFDAYVFAFPTLIYTGTQVQMQMQRNGTPFIDLCETTNQCEVGGGLDDLPVGDSLPDVVAALPIDAVRTAYDNLSGEIYGSTRAAILGDRQLRDAVNRRMKAHSPEGKHLWIDAWGHSGHVRDDANAAKVNVAGMGLALGADHTLTPNLTAGAFFGYEDKRIRNGSSRNSRSDVEGYSAGVYAAGNAGNFEVRGGVAYSRLDVETRRDIAVGTLQGRVTSDSKAHKVQAFIEASRPFTVNDRTTISPYLNVAQVWLRSKDATETGNAAALEIASQTDSVQVSTLGVRTSISLPTQTPIKLTANLGWAHAFGDTDGKTSNRFAGRGSRFEISGTGVDKNQALAGIGVQAQLSPNASLHAGYQGQFGSKTNSHTGQVQVRVRF